MISEILALFVNILTADYKDSLQQLIQMQLFIYLFICLFIIYLFIYLIICFSRCDYTFYRTYLKARLLP